MPYTQSLTIMGKSRSDGTTDRTVTMSRVENVSNGSTGTGYKLRETGVTPKLAATCVFRTKEERGAGGIVIRTLSEVWTWPYEDPAVPGVVAGYINHGPAGLKYPVDAPINVLKDVRTQLSNRAAATGGSVGFAHVYDPMVNGIIPF